MWGQPKSTAILVAAIALIHLIWGLRALYRVYKIYGAKPRWPIPWRLLVAGWLTSLGLNGMMSIVYWWRLPATTPLWIMNSGRVFVVIMALWVFYRWQKPPLPIDMDDPKVPG